MTFHDTIQIILEKTNNKLCSPVNVVISFYNANYIELELEERSIDQILLDKIPEIEHLSIQWIDDQNSINIQSYNKEAPNSLSSYQISSGNNDLNMEKHLEKNHYIGTTKNNQFKIYLANFIADEMKIEENGFIYNKSFAYYEHKYEFNHIELPSIKDYKYQNLYNYKDVEHFRYAILVEFILRQIRYNNLVPDQLTVTLQPKESETEEELELRANKETQNIENNINDILLAHFGLTYNEILGLQNIHNYWHTKAFQENELVLEIKYPSSPIKDCKMDFRLSKEKLIEQIKKKKENFDNEMNSCPNIKDKLSKEYLDKANEILDKFPKKFKIQQKQLIEALYIFDYIQASKLDIDEYNKNKDKLFKDDEVSISNIMPYPKMDTKGDDNFFHKIAQNITIEKGQAKKIHNHIHKFLEFKIS